MIARALHDVCLSCSLKCSDVCAINSGKVKPIHIPNKLNHRKIKDNDRKQASRDVFNFARRRLNIQPPKKCEHCGQETRLDAHHEDYERPLDVIWLCKSCHGKTWKKNAVKFEDLS